MRDDLVFAALNNPKRNATLLSETADKINNREVKVTIDLNGHGCYDTERICKIKRMDLELFSEEELRLMLVGEKVPAKNLFIKECNCPYCGKYFDFMFDGNTISIEQRCELPDGIKDVKFELNVPSGKMVFANDLRNWFRVQSEFNINSDIGKLQTVLAYEKIGMAHGFVGNTCPSVYQVDGKHLSISGRSYDAEEEDDEEQDSITLEEAVDNFAPPGKEVGSICTDLWWYCVVDYNDFKRRFLTEGGSLEDFESYVKDRCDVVKVDPGVYSFNHFFNIDRWEHEAPRTGPDHYAVIAWAREPDEKDLYEEYRKINYTIGQCWLATIAAYPDSYGFGKTIPSSFSMEDRVRKLHELPIIQIEKSVAEFYSRTFCDFGRDDWHPSGWGCSQEVPENTPDFILPPMTMTHHWDDMREEYCGLYLAGTGEESYLGGKIYTLNESFLNAAYEVAHAILKFGSAPSSHRTEAQNLENEKQKKKVALDSIKKLNERFPGTMPECCLEFLKP